MTLGLLQLGLPACAQAVQEAFQGALEADLAKLPAHPQELSHGLRALLAQYAFVLARLPMLLPSLGPGLAERVASSVGAAVSASTGAVFAGVFRAVPRNNGAPVARDLWSLGALYLLDEPLSQFFGASLGLRAAIARGLTEHTLGQELTHRLGMCEATSVCDVVATLISARSNTLVGIERGLGRLFLFAPDALLAVPDDGPVLYTFKNVASQHLAVRSGPQLRGSLCIGCLPPQTVFDVVGQAKTEDGAAAYRLAAGGWVGPVDGHVEAQATDGALATAGAAQGAWMCTGCSLPNYHLGGTCMHCNRAQSHAPELDASIWACPACTYNNATELPMCEICQTPRPGGTAQTRGKCTNAGCAMKDLSACAKYMPLTGAGASASHPVCSFCGCLATDHAVAEPEPAAPAGLPTAAVTTNQHVLVAQPEFPFQALFRRVLQHLAAYLADSTEHPAFDLPGLLSGNVNFYIDTLSSEGMLTPVDEVAEYLDQVAGLAALVTERDRLQLLLLDGVARRLLRGRSRDAALERRLGVSFGRLLGAPFTQRLHRMLDDHVWSQRLTASLHALSPATQPVSLLLCGSAWPAAARVIPSQWHTPPAVAAALQQAVSLHREAAFAAVPPFSDPALPVQPVTLTLRLRRRIDASPTAAKSGECWACPRSRSLGAECICGTDWSGFKGAPPPAAAAAAAAGSSSDPAAGEWVVVSDDNIRLGLRVKNDRKFREHGLGTIIGYRNAAGERVGDLRGIVSRAYVSIDYDDGHHWNSSYSDVLVGAPEAPPPAVVLPPVDDTPPPMEDEVHVVELNGNATLRAVREWLAREWQVPAEARILHQQRELADNEQTLLEGNVLDGEMCVVSPQDWVPCPQTPRFNIPPSTMYEALASGRLAAPGFITRPARTTLTVDPSQGTAHVMYRPKNCELVVSTGQMAVLLALDDVDSATYAELRRVTGLAHFVLERALLALTAPAHPVLKLRAREWTGRASFQDTDTFSVNDAWVPPAPVCWIRSSTLLESAEQASQRLRTLNAQRTVLLDAALVRVAKRVWVEQGAAASASLPRRLCRTCGLSKLESSFSRRQWGKPSSVQIECLMCQKRRESDASVQGGLSVDDLLYHVQRAGLPFVPPRELVSERVRFLIMEGFLVALSDDIVAYRPPPGAAELHDEAGPAASPVAAAEPTDNKVQRNNSSAPVPVPVPVPVLEKDTTEWPPTSLAGSPLLTQLSLRLNSVDPSSVMRIMSSVAQVGVQPLEEEVPGDARTPLPCVTLQTLQRELLDQVNQVAEQLGLTADQALMLLQDLRVGWDARLAMDEFFDNGLERMFHRGTPQGGPGAAVCCFHDLACAVDEGGVGWDHRLTLPCGHAFHVECFNLCVESTYLGFEVAGTGERAARAVLGATCPALDPLTGVKVCQEPIPWLTLLQQGFFGDKQQAVQQAWATDILNKYVTENLLLQKCPGQCERVFVSGVLPTNATNVVMCDECSLSFCFNCHGGWDEDHRPATCAQISRWGESVFELQPRGAGADKDGNPDHTMLDLMYIYRNTVRCPGPGCGLRVQKSSGCNHLTFVK